MILSTHNRNIAREMVDKAPDGHILEVRPPKRSLDSNRYYWAVLGDISEQVVPGKSYEPSIWHESPEMTLREVIDIMRRKYLG